ncbi:hypothetical protein DCC24_02490 [Auritidibacter sp. NML100628]|nr:hypothetical protein DCC24_02490 [Auritidibacter sp. NML100628]
MVLAVLTGVGTLSLFMPLAQVSYSGGIFSFSEPLSASVSALEEDAETLGWVHLLLFLVTLAFSLLALGKSARGFQFTTALLAALVGAFHIIYMLYWINEEAGYDYTVFFFEDGGMAGIGMWLLLLASLGMVIFSIMLLVQLLGRKRTV